MKKSRSSEEQIAFALRQVESGTPVEWTCRQLRRKWAENRKRHPKVVPLSVVRSPPPLRGGAPTTWWR